MRELPKLRALKSSHNRGIGTVLTHGVETEKSQTSISCMSTIGIQNSLATTSHTTNKTLYLVLWDVIPCCYESVHQFLSAMYWVSSTVYPAANLIP